MTTVIAVDAMGGDHGPAVTVPACLDFLDAHPGFELALVGLPEPIERELARAHAAGRAAIRVARREGGEVRFIVGPFQAALAPVFAEFGKKFGQANIDRIRNYKAE